MKNYWWIGANLVLLVFCVALFVVYSQDMETAKSEFSVARLMTKIAKRQQKPAPALDIPFINVQKNVTAQDVAVLIGDKNLFHRDRNMVIEVDVPLPPLPPIVLANPPILKYMSERDGEPCVGVKPKLQNSNISFPEELKVGDVWIEKWKVTEIEESGFKLVWDDPQRAKDEAERGMTPQPHEEFIAKPSRSGGGGAPRTASAGGGPRAGRGAGGAGGTGVITIGSDGAGGQVQTIGGGASSGGGRPGGAPAMASAVGSGTAPEKPAVQVMNAGGGADSTAQGQQGKGGVNSTRNAVQSVFKPSTSSTSGRPNTYGTSGTSGNRTR